MVPDKYRATGWNLKYFTEGNKISAIKNPISSTSSALSILVNKLIEV